MKRVLASIVILLVLCSAVCAVKPASKPAPKPNAKFSAPNYPTQTNPADGSVMINIPAGKFLMGYDHGERTEFPEHTVYLDSYQIGKYEVTVAQYRKFCKATGHAMPKPNFSGLVWKDDQPIGWVTYADAEAYCKWAGGRLPTEAEWEKAARGSDGRLFPWGNTGDYSKCVIADVEHAKSGGKPVGSYPNGASPYGCLDMVGNASEWCADWFDGFYYDKSPASNPKGPEKGSVRVVRGGSYVGSEDNASCTSRSMSGPAKPDDFIGIRLAK